MYVSTFSGLNPSRDLQVQYWDPKANAQIQHQRQQLLEATGPGMREQHTLFCSHCTQVFATRRELREHISACHSEHDQAFPYVCTLCGKGYGTQRGLQFHMNTHEGKSVSCPVCLSEFTREFAMKRHLRTAHNMKFCPTCNMMVENGPLFEQHVISCVHR